VFVTAGGPLSASGQTLPMSESLADSWTAPGTHVVPFRFRHMDWSQGGHSARVLLVLLDARAYRDAVAERYPSLPDREPYRRLSVEPGTVLVSENFSALHGVGPGDTLTLPAADGTRDFRILGTVADYSCTRGTVLLDRRTAGALGDGLVDVFSVTLPPGADADAARGEWLRSATGGELCAVTHAELREHTLGMVRRLYGVAAAQLAVAALVSVLGVAAAMTVSVLQRRGEHSLLRSLGATRGQVAWSVLAEAVGVGVLATAAGLIVGLPLEWVTLTHALRAETGFAFPPRPPGWEVLAVAAAALVGSAAAGLLPALTAARLSPAAIATGE
jgi:putative ABC transport system permease protein